MNIYGKHIYNFRESLYRLYALYLSWQTTEMSEEEHWHLAKAAEDGELIDLCGDLLQAFNALQCNERYQDMTVKEAIIDLLCDDMKN